MGRKCGASTGTNVYSAFLLMNEMQRKGLSGSIISFICDTGERYQNTYYNNQWIQENNFNLMNI